MTTSREAVFPVLRPTPAPFDARPLIVAFPFAGGGMGSYRDLLKFIPPDCAFTTVHLPGRDGRISEPPYRSMSDLVRDTVPIVSALRHRPFVLFGHSMGAAVAFAVTLELVNRRLTRPIALVVSGAGLSSQRTDKSLTHMLGDDDLLERLVAYGGVPMDRGEYDDLLRLMLPAVRADFELYETWTPAADATIADVRLCVVYGREDTSLSSKGLAAWESRTSGPSYTVGVPGGHFYPESTWQLVADILASECARAANDGQAAH